MGRKKVVLERIKNDRIRSVTFQKRRVGVIKKAMELSVLCESEVMVVVFGPDGKCYQFSSSGTFENMLHRVRQVTESTEFHNTDSLNQMLQMKKQKGSGNEQLGEMKPFKMKFDDNHVGPVFVTKGRQAEMNVVSPNKTIKIETRSSTNTALSREPSTTNSMQRVAEPSMRALSSQDTVPSEGQNQGIAQQMIPSQIHEQQLQENPPTLQNLPSRFEAHERSRQPFTQLPHSPLPEPSHEMYNWERVPHAGYRPTVQYPFPFGRTDSYDGVPAISPSGGNTLHPIHQSFLPNGNPQHGQHFQMTSPSSSAVLRNNALQPPSPSSLSSYSTNARSPLSSQQPPVADFPILTIGDPRQKRTFESAFPPPRQLMSGQRYSAGDIESTNHDQYISSQDSSAGDIESRGDSPWSKEYKRFCSSGVEVPVKRRRHDFQNLRISVSDSYDDNRGDAMGSATSSGLDDEILEIPQHETFAPSMSEPSVGNEGAEETSSRPLLNMSGRPSSLTNIFVNTDIKVDKQNSLTDLLKGESVDSILGTASQGRGDGSGSGSGAGASDDM